MHAVIDHSKIALAIIIISVLTSCGQKVNVTVEDGLEITKVKVSRGFFSINRATDKVLFNTEHEVIFENGTPYSFTTRYGENDFLVTYADEYYYQFRHFKTNQNSKDRYDFTLSGTNKNPKLKVSINKGQTMDFERNMNLIKDASKFKCNTLVDSAGTIYNMKEL